FTELRMMANAFDQRGAVPSIFACDRQPQVGARGPEPLERVEDHAMSLAGRNHADHQIGRMRADTLESGREIAAHGSAACPCSIEPGAIVEIGATSRRRS